LGTVAPDPSLFQIQGRPSVITPEAREAVLDFLVENGKLAYIEEVKIFRSVSGSTIGQLIEWEA
jgi:hypothetical protein